MSSDSQPVKAVNNAWNATKDSLQAGYDTATLQWNKVPGDVYKTGADVLGMVGFDPSHKKDVPDMQDTGSQSMPDQKKTTQMALQAQVKDEFMQRYNRTQFQGAGGLLDENTAPASRVLLGGF